MKVIGIIGKKMKMTQLINKEGLFFAATPIWVGENVVSKLINEKKEGYNACQIAFENCKEKKLNQPLLKWLKKINISPKKNFREIKNMSGLEIGQTVEPSLFSEGDLVKVSGTSKGKGTEGVVTRWGFGGGKRRASDRGWERSPGSTGGGRGTNQGTPAGKKMAGRMGNELITQKSLIAKIDSENKIIYIRGAVPGPWKGLITLKKEINR